MQEIYLEWVNLLVRSRDPYIRERVALVTGLLAAHDFEFVRSRLLLGWAADADERLRRAAATALRPPALDAHLAGDRLESARPLGDPRRERRPRERSSSVDGDHGPWRPGRRHGPGTGAPPDHAAPAPACRERAQLRIVGGHRLRRQRALRRRRIADQRRWSCDVARNGRRQSSPVPATSPSSSCSASRASHPIERSLTSDGSRPCCAQRVVPGNIEHAVVLWRQALGHRKFATAALKACECSRRMSAPDGGDELTALVNAIPRHRP